MQPRNLSINATRIGGRSGALEGTECAAARRGSEETSARCRDDGATGAKDRCWSVRFALGFNWRAMKKFDGGMLQGGALAGK